MLISIADEPRVSRDIGDLIDTFKLQRDLNVVYQWANENNMQFNNCKFEHVKYGKDNPILATLLVTEK